MKSFIFMLKGIFTRIEVHTMNIIVWIVVVILMGFLISLACMNKIEWSFVVSTGGVIVAVLAVYFSHLSPASVVISFGDEIIIDSSYIINGKRQLAILGNVGFLNTGAMPASIDRVILEIYLNGNHDNAIIYHATKEIKNLAVFADVHGNYNPDKQLANVVGASTQIVVPGKSAINRNFVFAPLGGVNLADMFTSKNIIKLDISPITQNTYKGVTKTYIKNFGDDNPKMYADQAKFSYILSQELIKSTDIAE